MKKIFVLVAALMLLALALVACGGEGETVEVEVTRIVEVPVAAEGGEVVEVEVTRIVEVAAEAGAAQEEPMATTGATLDTVRERGYLNCAANGTLAGFGFIDEAGNWSGFDWDYCRAIAAAVLGDSEAVEGRAVTAQERFPVLQSGEADVLVRNTTWTTQRDTALGFDFAPVTFYDGQGMMVRVDSGIETLEDLEGGSVCVQAGTTTEKNLADVFRQLNINAETIVFPDNPSTSDAYNEGRCDGLTTDKSGLVSVRANQMDVPEDHVILDATMSKEPLAPLTRHGDNNWNDIVSWTVYCTIEAEQLGITSENVDEFLGSDDPYVLNVLGVEGDLGQPMGLNNDWCYQVIKQVGNYGEIYNSNLGPDTRFNVPRGLNSPYTEGGLLYSMPFR
ncbi:MAG: amino acid ABC transporter substrate-binding protein [Chloroflexota bacterium]|jgi:general L-amino acid transport system substrate-binding protein